MENHSSVSRRRRHVLRFVLRRRINPHRIRGSACLERHGIQLEVDAADRASILAAAPGQIKTYY